MWWRRDAVYEVNIHLTVSHTAQVILIIVPAVKQKARAKRCMSFKKSLVLKTSPL